MIFWRERLGPHPELTINIRIGKTDTVAILDTGSQVTTITESVFSRLLSCKLRDSPPHHIFRLTAANGLSFSLGGYIVCDVEVNGERDC